MLFNSYEFFIFFPIVTALFFVLPHNFRWLLLLIASCIFYMYFVPIYILILLGTIIIDYIAGIIIERAKGKKRKWWLIVSILANIGVLAVFKYYNFFIDNINNITNASLPFLRIVLPIGLSFHTFQAMSYTIEVYRGNYPAEKHLGIYALYVMFYPQLVAGPIERPQNVLYQFHEIKRFDYDNAASGLRLMMWGMIKKVVIADRLSLFTDPIFNNPYEYPGISILIAAVFFSFQIFCDFSGYSDIALGTARVMGFKLMVNFNKPYHSWNISEFWKRWHISLSTWFRDYLYIPLGGNRVTINRTYFNLFFVFILSGFWHGANWTFIIWGALHGFYLVIGLMTKQIRNSTVQKLNLHSINWFNISINIISVFVLVTFAWIFFRANNLNDAFHIISKIGNIPDEILQIIKMGNYKLLNIDKSLLLSCTGVIMILEMCHIIDTKFSFTEKLQFKPFYIRWSVYISALAFILLFGLFNSKNFIYFQF